MSLRRLSGLAKYPLARVAHALALVGLGLADLADVGGDLTHLLLVDAPHGDPGGHRDLEGDALGRVDRDRVRKPEGELERGRAAQRGSVADADDLELLGKALG